VLSPILLAYSYKALIASPVSVLIFPFASVSSSVAIETEYFATSAPKRIIASVLPVAAYSIKPIFSSTKVESKFKSSYHPTNS
jgi:hypothetical protein